MEIIQTIMTNNPCYKAGRKITVQGLMLHSVGCSQPNAMVFVNSWNRSDFGTACVHAFIDGNNGKVYQCLPWDHRGWHGGSGKYGSCNNTHIGVEMCEPACIRYTGGSTFTCSDWATAQASVKRTYNSAVELFAKLCKEYKLDPLTDIISHKEGHAKGIATDHGDPEHLWKGLKMGYTMAQFRKDVKAKMTGGVTAVDGNAAVKLRAVDLKDLSQENVISKVGPLFTADQKSSGILASVSMAQFLLESAYAKSELAQNANNCFGMKKNLSGNNWAGSKWDGKSVYKKQTGEQNSNGSYVTITAEFRKYSCINDSIADHSAYLLGAMNGSKKRYNGLKGCTDYKKALQIIKDGGYATSLQYVSNLVAVIEKWGLTKYDIKVVQPTHEFSTNPMWTGVVTASALRMRSNAGTDSSCGIIKEILKGKEVKVCDQTTGRDGKQWYYIFYNGYYGFVSAQYVQKKVSTPVHDVEDARYLSDSVAGTYTVTASALKMRKGAGTKKATITQVKRGQKVTCYGYYNVVNGVKWLLVKWGDRVGYMSSEYLRK